jgi:hypothetical protein
MTSLSILKVIEELDKDTPYQQFYLVKLLIKIIKLEVRGNFSIRLKQICAYADYVLILARTWQAVVDRFLKLKHEAEKVGVIKVMKCCRNLSSEN